MSSEARFALAVVLMLGVLIGTSVLFSPPPPPPGEEPVEAAPEPGTPPRDRPPAAADAPVLPELTEDPAVPSPAPAPVEPERLVTVESPLYTMTFSTVGAKLRSAELSQFVSFARDGAVELVGDPDRGMLGSLLVVGADTVDLRRLSFTVEPVEGIRLEAGGAPQTLSFRYVHPSDPFSFEVVYTFHPDSYLIEARGRARGLDRGLLVTDFGSGIAFNEADRNQEARSMAYVANHLQNGVRTNELRSIERSGVEEGPFRWVAVKSRYFVVALLPEQNGAEFLGGILLGAGEPPAEGEDAIGTVAATQSLGSAGTFSYQVFAGPQDYALLSAMGQDLQEVNPVGWRFLRPILRPVVAVIMWVLVFFHTTLSIGYGWVLILFGVLMRVVLFPLNHKAMRAQLRNMAVQPLLKEIQTKHKDNPEKMQKELMRLYKEHGFNPLAGCWPMLLPWPVLIALFFVFQNTIELRGVPFAWLPDLAAKDPLFILPVLLGVSMFLLQWVSIRTMEEVHPQMKMMMWVLPIVMLIVFANLPSGLNLYYLTANVATLPQSWWIARERQKVQAKGPPVPAKA